MINAFKAARLTNQTLSGVGSTLTYAGQGLVPYSGSTGNLILGNTQNISVGLVTVGYNGLGSVVSGVGNYYGIQYNMNDNSYWYNGGLYSADGSGIAINANGGVRYLYRGNSYPTVDFANMQLVNGFSNVSIDWLNKILSGAWTVNSLKLVSGATNNTVPLLFSGGYLNVNGQNLAYQVAGGYVPYAGATGTVNLNNQILTGVNSIGVNGNVMPMTNNAYSLGTPLMAWGSAYIGTLVGTGAYLNDMNAVDVNNCKLHADLPGITLDWSGKFLTGGTWQAQNLLISGSPVITAAQTGQFYAANNPLGFVTNAALSGTVVSIGGLSGVINLTGSSGVVITTGGSNLITVALNNSGQFASASAFNNTGALLQSEINQFSGIVVNTTGAFITTSMTGQFQSASQFVLTGTNIQGQLNALSGILGGTGGLLSVVSGQMLQSEINQFSGIVVNTTGAFDTVSARNTALSSYTLNTTFNNTGQMLQSEINQFSGMVTNTTGAFLTSSSIGSYGVSAIQPVGWGQAQGNVYIVGAGTVSITTGVTGASGWPLLIFSGATGSYVSQGQTGQFITQSMTGQFQSASQFQLTGNNIQTQFNTIYGTTGAFATSVSVAATGAAFTFFSGNQQSFSYYVPTGYDNTGVLYPVAFASAPRVLVSLEIPTNIMYMVNISNRTNTGFYAVFSDVVQESGVILHTFATLNR